MIEFIDKIKESIHSNTFVKCTLSGPINPTNDWLNAYFKISEIKNEIVISCTEHYKTNDKTKNYSIDDFLLLLTTLLNNQFKNATLFTSTNNYSLLRSKKGKTTIVKSKATHFETVASHDREKFKHADLSKKYLNLLGITDNSQTLIPRMADKYRQINKYLEIIEAQLKHIDCSKDLTVVDMGSGKGYLTFALYDYLTDTKGIQANVIGIELREDLVNVCNDFAKQCNYKNLSFINQRIEQVELPKIDVLIALHACDTATDDALFKGIMSKAKLIVCAPCCHKELRQQVKGIPQENPIIQYGIFKERQFEMLTDTLRALTLEANNYHTHLFEFISNEHTRKNIMLTAYKNKTALSEQKLKDIKDKQDRLKKEFQISHQHLDVLLQS
jgi:tRNA A58 N-methylase Trm61